MEANEIPDELREFIGGSLQDAVARENAKRASLSPEEFARWKLAKHARQLAELIETDAPELIVRNEISVLARLFSEL